RAGTAVGAIDPNHDIARWDLGGIVEPVQERIENIGFNSLWKNCVGDELVACAQSGRGAHKNFVTSRNNEPQASSIQAAAAVGNSDLGSTALPTVESACP